MHVTQLSKISRKKQQLTDPRQDVQSKDIDEGKAGSLRITHLLGVASCHTDWEERSTTQEKSNEIPLRQNKKFREISI